MAIDKEAREQRKTEFLDAAERLFSEKGILNTSVSTIVKELNVAKGLFYYYFKSKDEVIDAISKRYSTSFEENLMEEIKEDGTYDERLEGFIDAMIDSFRKVKSKIGNNREDTDMAILSSRILKDAKTFTSKKLCALLEEGNRIGKLNVSNPTYLSDMIVSAISDLSNKANTDFKEVKKIIMDAIKRS